MSRSPRKSLRRTLDALDECLAVIDRHPEAAAEVAARLGAAGIVELREIRGRLAAAAARLDAGGPETGATDGDGPTP